MSQRKIAVIVLLAMPVFGLSSMRRITTIGSASLLQAEGGSRLLAYLLEKVFKRCEQSFRSKDSNLQARKIYERFGFEVFGKRKKYIMMKMPWLWYALEKVERTCVFNRSLTGDRTTDDTSAASAKRPDRPEQYYLFLRTAFIIVSAVLSRRLPRAVT